MYQFNKDYYTRICNYDLIFKISKVALTKQIDCGPFFDVHVRILGANHPIHGGNLKLNLLDNTYSPLKKTTSNLDHIDLPSFTWSGNTSIFKVDQFEQLKDPPCYLQIHLFDHCETLPLWKEGDPQEPLVEDPTTETPDTFIDDPQGEAAKPKCCPDTFITPIGPQPTTIRRRPNPAGGFLGAILMMKPWVIQATFKAAPPPCKCDCCEYRQRVKGIATLTPAGGGPAIDITPVTDYAPFIGPPAPGAPPPAPVPIKGVNPGGFVEDTVGDPQKPGNPMGYGRRNDLNPRPNGLFVPQDYPTICSYWGLDAPGTFITGGLLPIGSTLNLDLTFEGTIIDTCNGNAVVDGPKIWTWKYVGVI